MLSQLSVFYLTLLPCCHRLVVQTPRLAHAGVVELCMNTFGKEFHVSFSCFLLHGVGSLVPASRSAFLFQKGRDVSAGVLLDGV